MKRRAVWLSVTWLAFYIVTILNAVDFRNRWVELQDGALKGTHSPFWPGSVALWAQAMDANRNGHLFYEGAALIGAIGATILINRAARSTPSSGASAPVLPR
jgi:hypothetical protein